MKKYDPNYREIKIFNPETKEDAPRYCNRCGKRFESGESYATHQVLSRRCFPEMSEVY